jgi:hypothetical protein
MRKALPEVIRGGTVKVEVEFGPGFHYKDDPDKREFRARYWHCAFEMSSLAATLKLLGCQKPRIEGFDK